MNDLDDFLSLIRDELGIEVGSEDSERSLDEIPGWDSVHLLWLLSIVEQRTGRSVSLPDVLEASTLGSIYSAVAG
ncbi:Acyl carrier protein [Frankia sp. AiPs1]|uniref:acyl carrier protein n=1 Tax=Frankia sp. AiPa1 TaxID=573492 RepID=UPI00202B3BF5|nr:acyl carrier protein [Frankia sp. AiPa1]MCL9762953.1 phosphopantetheine-binding protein [Frankia sp. AiPa1]